MLGKGRGGARKGGAGKGEVLPSLLQDCNCQLSAAVSFAEAWVLGLS